jgi:2-keto-4-pentenoate hydratase/2-oxohepta-3-ene-1,7-dioic acid hydratase in catechol pathway
MCRALLTCEAIINTAQPKDPNATMTQWVRFRSSDGRVRFGTLADEWIVEHQGDLFDRPSATERKIPRETVKLLAPCLPTKVIALWNNFRALGAKLGKAAPVHPLFLIKPPSSLAGPDDLIRRPATYSGKIAYEGELAIVIGKTCANVSVDEAGKHIFGYTCINDVTAAELLNEDGNFQQWCRSKGFDTFSCLGPAITTGFDWALASVVTTMGGVERQNYPLSDMIFTPEEQVSRISQDMTLLPGDVIACGTSIGLGSIKDGATVEVFIEGIGTLTNSLAA